MSMSYRIAALSCFLMLLFVSINEGSDTPTRKPNIVFILADDLGWRDLGCYGSKFYETPHIDQLAKRGMRFVNAYAANPLCSPTRASLLTGQYPGRLRFTTPAGHLKKVTLEPNLPVRASPTQKAVTPGTRTRLPLEYHTIAEALKDNGYRTGHFGKWHLGWSPYQPQKQGFDINLPGGSYPGPPNGYFAPHNVPGFKDGPTGQHIEDRMTTEAIEFLKTNKDRPFFLNYWMFSVHARFQAKEKLIEKYRKKADPKGKQRAPVMGGMIETMDACVGRLVKALDDLGLSDNTLIIFFSDNGGNMYNQVEGGTPTNNYPLRGGKASIYEGGVRVPCIAVWPKHIQANTTNKEIISSIDFYPTLLDITGAKSKNGQVVDGQSLTSVLFDGKSLNRNTFFCHFSHYVKATGNLPSTSVRQGDWKLIRYYADGTNQKNRFELYNLSNDIGEKANLAAEMRDKVDSMDALIERHLKETNALVPKANPAYDPTIRAPMTINGWRGSKDTALKRVNGQLVLKSLGRDPFIAFQKLSVGSGPFTLVLKMKSKVKGRGQVFWTTRKSQGFHRDRSMTFAMTHDGKLHGYQIQLPVQERVVSLRIDPGQQQGEVTIQSMQLQRGKTLIKEWLFTKE